MIDHTSPVEARARILDQLNAMTRDAVVVASAAGLVLSWNQAAERMFGHAADDMRGRPLRTIASDDQAQDWAALVHDAGRGASVTDRELKARSASGEALLVVVSATPVRDEADAVVGVLVVATDVTGQRQTERALSSSEGRWGAVVESAVDAMIVIDSRGHVEAFNPAAERLFGYSASEVLGNNVSMLMPSPYREEHDGYMANYLRTGTRKIIGIGREVRARRRDGTDFPMRLSVGEMLSNGEKHFTGILHDLTSRVELEARLREQNALARLGEMAAVIAHEVKNPLAAVRGAVQVIGGRLPAGSKEVPIVGQVIARIDALDELIKDLLLFARTPQPRPAPVALASLLNLIVEFLGTDPLLSDVEIRISGVLPPIQADPELLRVVFQNLLLNAAQAMHGRGTIRVALEARPDCQRVIIADEGPGLSAEARANLFRPFFTTKSRGTGLGLPTAKRLVELHSGTLDVESVPSQGTTVTVTLPTPVFPA